MSRPRSRRRVCAALAASVGATGCLSAPDPAPAAPVTLSGVEVENRDDTAHTVTVEVVSGGDTIVTETVHAPADAFVPSVDAPAFPHTSTDWWVVVSMGDQRETITTAVASVDCTRVVVRITPASDLVVGNTTDCYRTTDGEQ